MKNLISNRRTAIMLLVIAAVVMFFYVSVLARPVSYEASYYHASEYEGDSFDGAMIFYPDSSMRNRNTNLDEDMISRYYYKDGYIFLTMPESDEEYEKEVALINANFEEAVSTPFYAAKINAFKLTMEGPDGYASIYFCRHTVIFAVACGAIELALLGLAHISFKLSKKAKTEKAAV